MLVVKPIVTLCKTSAPLTPRSFTKFTPGRNAGTDLAYCPIAMRKPTNRMQMVSAVITIAVSLFFSASAEAQKVSGSFIYILSNFTGPISHNWSRVTADKENKEIYSLYQNTLSVFNDSGMEVFQFGDDLDLGQIVDVSVDHGDILLLSYRDSRASIVRCNFRGEPKSRIELKNLPSDFSDFGPNRMVFQGGNFYLASFMGLKVVVADREGGFKKGYDLFSLLELEEKDRGNVELFGFNVDSDGNILMTIPVLFSAYVLSPDGKIKSFGKPGGAPGRFNIVSGIARDNKGNYLVADKLKAAVMVFDKNFNFLSQFGSYGFKPGNLVSPDEIAIDSGDRVYVTQTGKRGVSVFKLSYN
jgi:hypothetical protein